MEEKKIFIKGNVPSSKNSRRNFKGKSLPSKATITYIKAAIDGYINNKDIFLDMLNKYPTDSIKLVGMHFVRKSKHRWDFHNAVQIICDLMSKYRWVEDDNASIMIPVPLEINGYSWTYDKNNPGVYISIIGVTDFKNKEDYNEKS